MVTGITSWSHDGSKVVFTGAEPGRPPRVFLLDPTSGVTRAITQEETSDPLLTPDGEMLLVKDNSMAYVIYSMQGGHPEPTKRYIGHRIAAAVEYDRPNHLCLGWYTAR
jgi:Tol biopolymer transport system component